MSNAVNHCYKTRAKKMYIRTPCHKTRISDKSVSNYGATIYNLLHYSFKIITDNRSSKSKLQSFLCECGGGCVHFLLCISNQNLLVFVWVPAYCLYLNNCEYQAFSWVLISCHNIHYF